MRHNGISTRISAKRKIPKRRVHLSGKRVTIDQEGGSISVRDADGIQRIEIENYSHDATRIMRINPLKVVSYSSRSVLLVTPKFVETITPAGKQAIGQGKSYKAVARLLHSLNVEYDSETVSESRNPDGTVDTIGYSVFRVTLPTIPDGLRPEQEQAAREQRENIVFQIRTHGLVGGVAEMQNALPSSGTDACFPVKRKPRSKPGKEKRGTLENGHGIDTTPRHGCAFNGGQGSGGVRVLDYIGKGKLG